MFSRFLSSSCVLIELVLQVLSSFQRVRENLHPVLKCWNFPNPWHCEEIKSTCIFSTNSRRQWLGDTKFPFKSRRRQVQWHIRRIQENHHLKMFKHTNLRVENQSFSSLTDPNISSAKSLPLQHDSNHQSRRRKQPMKLSNESKTNCWIMLNSWLCFVIQNICSKSSFFPARQHAMCFNMS